MEIPLDAAVEENLDPGPGAVIGPLTEGDNADNRPEEIGRERLSGFGVFSLRREEGGEVNVLLDGVDK